MFDGTLCVLKSYDLATASMRRQLLRSVQLMRSLAPHPHIATVEAIFEEAGSRGKAAYVQLPFYNKGTLSMWLRAPENTTSLLGVNGNSGESVVDRHSERGMLLHVRALHQALSGIAYVHGRGHVHGDLKLENMLVDSQGDVKLSDFDFARSSSEKEAEVSNMYQSTRAGAGTPAYMPPEVQRGGCATSASDIYSFGVCVLHAMVPEVVVEHDFKTFARRIPDCCKQDGVLWDLLCRTLAPKEQDRPTAAVLLQHSFFRVDYLLQEADKRREAKEAKEREEEEARQARLRECSVCMEECDLAEGLSCEDPSEPHFVCDECLAGHVGECTSAEQQRLLAERPGVWCVAQGGGCKQVYSEQALARHLSPDVFDAYFAAKSMIKEAEISSSLEKGFEDRVKKEVNASLALSEAERRMRANRNHIIERILQFACPRCGQVYPEILDGKMVFDKDQCFALSCQSCPCKFCAYCLKDCGADAHAHVAAKVCSPVNKGPGAGLFPKEPEETFRAANKWRRENGLKAFLARIPLASEREALVKEVSIELRDLNLDPSAFT